jgi:hypothetical protein
MAHLPDPKFQDILMDMEQPESDYEVDEIKEELDEEVENLKQEIEEDREKFKGIGKIIRSICKDMSSEYPDEQNRLNKLLKKLDERAGLADKIANNGLQLGGKDKGVRLSSLENRVKSLQDTFTTTQINEKLKKFKKVSMEELFDMPKGVWCRYFLKNEQDKKKRGKYRTGGFIIHKDPEKRYVTLMAHHNDNTPHKNSFTWNMQVKDCYSVYVTTKNVRAYRLKKVDKKYKLREGTATFLNKWFRLDPGVLVKFQSGKGIKYVIYDKVEHTLYAPRGRQSNKNFLNVMDINQNDFKKQLTMGLKKQLEKPFDDLYIVTIVDKDDLAKVRKMKSRIK